MLCCRCYSNTWYLVLFVFAVAVVAIIVPTVIGAVRVSPASSMRPVHSDTVGKLRMESFKCPYSVPLPLITQPRTGAACLLGPCQKAGNNAKGLTFSAIASN